MDAIVMAGGFGQRLGMGEKPCVDLLGKPLISYVIDTLKAAKEIDRVFVAVSPVTPKTEIMLHERYKGEIRVIRTFGGNYVGDMIYAVETAQTAGPIMIIMSDLPLINPELVDFVIEKYREAGTPALSVYVPINICKGIGIRPDTVFNKDGKLIVPVGINVLDSFQIRQEQEDFNLILENTMLAINVNTAEDLQRCKDLLQRKD
jgi:adenosylcobinamide-phosphate guanylyltransferase